MVVLWGAMKSRAPLLLGRGVVTRSAAEVPDQWSGTEGFVIDGQLLDDSVRLEKTVDELQRRYVNRNPTVFVVDVDPEELNAFETTDAPPYELGSEFTFLREMVERLAEGERLNVRTIHSMG